MSSLSYEDCKTLITTYNASILKKLPRPLQASFLREAKDCLEKNKVKTETETKDRTVLAKLINNLIENETVIQTLPNVGFMDGPLNISLHWSKTFQKLIYIFGEIHIGKRCPLEHKDSTKKIEDYLVEWFRKPSAYTDFYLEIEGFQIPDGYGNFSGKETIDVLRELFKVCIDKKTRDQEMCNLSRMHFFDIRLGGVKGRIPVITRILYNIARLLLDLEYSEDVRLISTFWDNNMDYFDILSKITEYSEQEYKEFWYDQLYNFQIIKKEIDNMNENVRPYLNYFIKNELDTDIFEKMIQIKDILRKIYNQRYIIWQNTSRLTISNFIQNLQIFVNLTKKIDALFIDAYLLARIFKTFKINDPDKRRLVDEPSEPHNIIIYAGSGHSARYRKFLNTLGFKTLEKSGGGFDGVYEGLHYVKCINMKEANVDEIKIITSPLFNRWPSEDDNGFENVDQATLKEYESFETTFNIKSDDTLPEPDDMSGPDDMTEPDDMTGLDLSEYERGKRVVRRNRNKKKKENIKPTIQKSRR